MHNYDKNDTKKFVRRFSKHLTLVFIFKSL